MHIVPIFADVENDPPKGLFAVRLNDNGDGDEYKRFMEWAQDVEMLRRFFNERNHLLEYGYYKGTTVNDAVISTMEQVGDFEDALLERKGNMDHLTSYLNECFQPLNNHEHEQRELQKSKTRGISKSNWIRFYAIKVDESFYIITGGGIKLVGRMEEDELLRTQLSRIGQVRDFLKENGLFEPSAYTELFLDL